MWGSSCLSPCQGRCRLRPQRLTLSMTELALQWALLLAGVRNLPVSAPACSAILFSLLHKNCGTVLRRISMRAGVTAAMRIRSRHAHRYVSEGAERHQQNQCRDDLRRTDVIRSDQHTQGAAAELDLQGSARTAAAVELTFILQAICTQQLVFRSRSHR